jgi:hypothetical protein
MVSSTKAAVLVAGLPGRDFPADSPPKCLLHVEGRVILDRLLTAIRDGGVDDIRLVVGYEARQIERWVAAMRLDVEIVENPRWRTDAVASMELGLAGAAGDVLVVSGDILIDASLIAAFLRTDPRRPAWIRSELPWDAPRPLYDDVYRNDIDNSIVKIPRHLLGMFRDSRPKAERFLARYPWRQPTHAGTGLFFGAAITETFAEHRPIEEVVIPRPIRDVDFFYQTDEHTLWRRVARNVAARRRAARVWRPAPFVRRPALAAAPAGRLVVGLCTVAGRATSYLGGTVESLLGQRSGRSDTVVVVYHCDPRGVENPDVEAIRARFAGALASGALRVVRVDVPPGVSHDDAYLAWRAKQNHDFSEAFRLGAGQGDYYMHVEDDVVACRDYDLYVFQEMQRHPAWGVLRMAQGGAIGFVFRTGDLEAARAALLDRARDQPADWILEAHAESRGLVRPRYSIFQHVGRDRSLTGATQPVVFEDFIGTAGPDA